jgi:uncharacterized membrane protein YidH (DUF202 family)
VSTPQVRVRKPAGFLSLPRTALGWAAVGFALAHFLFMLLFRQQAGQPGRDRSTFFSDPVNAALLIAAFAAPITGAALALVAMALKRERSFLLIPVLLMGLAALLWSLGVLLG